MDNHTQVASAQCGTESAENIAYRKISDIEKTVDLLRHLGGTEMNYNPYSGTIIRLEGVVTGFRMLERALDS